MQGCLSWQRDAIVLEYRQLKPDLLYEFGGSKVRRVAEGYRMDFFSNPCRKVVQVKFTAAFVDLKAIFLGPRKHRLESRFEKTDRSGNGKRGTHHRSDFKSFDFKGLRNFFIGIFRRCQPLYIIRSDQDDNMQIEEDEIEDLIQRIQKINGVEVREDRFKAAIMDSGGSLSAVMDIIKNLMADDVSDADEIFIIKETPDS